MRGSRTFWRRQAARLARGLAAPALLALAGPAQADEPKLPDALPAAVAPAAAAPLTLQACRQIALEKQPAVAAARATLAAAAARAEAVERLRAPGFLAPDLPVRRKQAPLGVQSAQAALAQAEADAAHAVAFTYLAALYAREQQRVADDAVARLKDLEKFASDFVEAGATTVTKRNVEQIRVYSLVAQARREEAVQGVERALSGLREAMGVGPDCPLTLAADSLPDVNPPVDRGQVIALAVARRGEVAQANTAVEVTCLEIDAQAANRHGRRVNTFAAGSDIHANVLPAGEHGTTAYKPGAVALEMPTLIAGSRDDRVEQARAYHARAQAVAEKARGLVALEAEQAYLHWLEASRKAPTARKAADDARKLFEALRKEYEPRNPRTRMEDLLNAGVVASQLRVQANEAHYQLLRALASLERATGGGFCAGLDLPAAPAAPPANGEGKNNGNDKEPNDMDQNRTKR